MAIAVITLLGRKKLCQAHAGEISLPPITKMVFGDGGVSADGSVIKTTGTEVALRKQLLEKTIQSHSFSEDKTKCTYTVKLEENELVGKQISEVGFFDSEGDLIAYKTFLPKGKDDDFAFTFHLTESFPVNL